MKNIGLFFLFLSCTFLSACGSNSSSSATPVGSNTTEDPNVPVNTSCPILDPPIIKGQQGEATFYVADQPGNCSLPLPDDLMIAAMNDSQYAEAVLCGSCLSVSGPNGKVVVKVVDRCPECLSGDLDLSEAAFARIADPAQGRVDIVWEEIPCDTQAPLQYHFKAGSNQWWTAIQVRHHRHRIKKLEVLNSNHQYQEIPRVNYNYFFAENGLGSGPVTLRVTDIHGNLIEDASIPIKEESLAISHSQFPGCNI